MLVSHRRDQLIEFVKSLLRHSFVLDALPESAENTFRHIEELIEEHRSSPFDSRLKEAVPSVGLFHTALPLARAYRRFDATYKISRRRFVSPSFNEIREILNLAQVLAFERPGERTTSLKFVTFDGDCTLYSDGKNFNDMNLAASIARLLRAGVCVALVTAAGYGYEASKYEKRLDSLLQFFFESFRDSEEKEDILRRFYVLGGESNYLLQAGLSMETVILEPRKDAWSALSSVNFDEAEIQFLLDVAERSLRETVSDLNLKNAKVIRKARAIGLVPSSVRREILDEAVLRAQEALKKHKLASENKIPYCAFNGGSDVWVDVGNKEVGVTGLQQLLDVKPESSLHIGDQFLQGGNDLAARGASCCLWITDPNETKAILTDILDVIEKPHTPDDDPDQPVAPSSPRNSHKPRLFPPEA